MERLAGGVVPSQIGITQDETSLETGQMQLGVSKPYSNFQLLITFPLTNLYLSLNQFLSFP